MATAEELISSISETADVLTIDMETRVISIPESVRNLGVESDDDVKRLYFSMPRMYGEFDLSDFKTHINYMNAGNEGDIYEVDDMVVGLDESGTADTLDFTWLIGRYVTKFKGDVNFIVCLKLSGTDPETGEDIVVKEFNTTVATLSVLEGLETGEAVVQANPDVIERILVRLDELGEGGSGGGNVVVPCTIELPVDGWVGDSEPYFQVVTIADATANSQINFQPTVDQLIQLNNDGTILTAGNEGGVITVYAIGSKPTVDYTFKALMTEVKII